MFPTILLPTRITDTSSIVIDNIFVSHMNIFNSGLLTVDSSDPYNTLISHGERFATNENQP